MTLAFKIFIIISLYGIFRIITEILKQRKCPSDRDLRSVILGVEKKNSTISERVIMHLGICEKCQEKAREIGSE